LSGSLPWTPRTIPLARAWRSRSRDDVKHHRRRGILRKPRGRVATSKSRCAMTEFSSAARALRGLEVHPRRNRLDAALAARRYARPDGDTLCGERQTLAKVAVIQTWNYLTATHWPISGSRRSRPAVA
jgi:hypothetical protein